MLNKRLITGIVIGTSAALIAACGSSGSSSTSSKSGPSSYTVTIDEPVATATGAPLYVAIQKGYFAQQGIKIKFSTLSTASSVQEALTSGSIQFATGGAFSIVLANEKGANYQVVESFGGPSFQVCANTAYAKSLGISASTPLKQMLTKVKGATVGVNGFGSPVTIPLQYLLKADAGLDPQTSIKIVNLGSVAAARTALERGSIDIVVNSPPVCEETSGKGEVLLTTSFLPVLRTIPYQVFYGSKNWLSSHATIASRVGKALAEGNNFVKSNPTAAAQILHQGYFPTVSAASLASLLKTYVLPNLPANGRMTEQGWQNVNTIMKISGATSSPPSAAEGVMWTNKSLPAS